MVDLTPLERLPDVVAERVVEPGVRELLEEPSELVVERAVSLDAGVPVDRERLGQRLPAGQPGSERAKNPPVLVPLDELGDLIVEAPAPHPLDQFAKQTR